MRGLFYTIILSVFPLKFVRKTHTIYGNNYSCIVMSIRTLSGRKQMRISVDEVRAVIALHGAGVKAGMQCLSDYLEGIRAN